MAKKKSPKLFDEPVDELLCRDSQQNALMNEIKRAKEAGDHDKAGRLTLVLGLYVRSQMRLKT